MLEMQTSRETAQKVYTVIHNVDGDTVTGGMATRYVGGAAAEIVSADGVSAVKVTAAADFANLAGIAKRDIPSDGYGIVQNWGYVDSVLISALANVTANPGKILRASAAAGQLEGVTGDNAINLSTLAISDSGRIANQVECWTTVNVSGGLNYGSGFIRAI